MARKSINRLGELERTVMETVWAMTTPERRTVSVREVHQALSTNRDIAYTTVMTVMGRLAEGGLLSRQRSGRAYLYAAVGTREELTASTMREQLNAVSGEDRRAAILHFLDDASADEISELKAALAEVEARQASSIDKDSNGVRR